MEPNIRELVRDWRLDIISEGMYITPSVITEALTTGNVERARQSIALETKKEIDDYSSYRITGHLPVAEYLQTVMNYELMEGTSGFKKGLNRAIGLFKAGNDINMRMLKDPRYRAATNRRLKISIASISAGSGNVIKTGNFDKAKVGLERALKQCNTISDINYLQRDKQQALKDMENALKSIQKTGFIPASYGKNKKPPYTIKELNDYISWVKTDYSKMISERRKALTSKMEALSLDEYGEPVEELFAFGKKKEYRLATDKELDAAKKVIDYTLSCYPALTSKIKVRKMPTLMANGEYIFATCSQNTKGDDSFIRSLNSELSSNDIYLHAIKDDDTLVLVSRYEKGSKENAFNPKAGQGELSDAEIKQITAIIRKHLGTYSKIKGAVEVFSVDAIKSNHISGGSDAYYVADIDNLKLPWDDEKGFHADDYDNFVNAVEKDLSSKFPVTVSVDEGIFVSVKSVAESVLYEPSIDFNITFGALTESMFDVIHECGFNPNQRNLNEITPIDGGARFSVTPWSNAEKTVGLALCDICEAETDEEITESLMHFGRVAEAVNREYTGAVLEADDFDEVEESIGSVARGAVRKARAVSRKVSRKVDHAVKSANVMAKKDIDPIVALIDKNMEKFKKADAAERREIVIKGGLLPKIMRWIKRSIGLLVGVAVGAEVPIVALITAITFIGMICSDKFLDRRERQQILKQLEDEIEIVNEKIDDSRNDSNRKAKYELMRIRNKLKRTSDKIRYNLRTSADKDIVQNMKQGKKNVT